MRERSGRLKASLSRDKGCGVEAVTSAGTFQGCYAEEVVTCDCSACAVRLLSVTVGPPVPSARVVRSACSDATLRKEALQTNPHS